MKIFHGKVYTYKIAYTWLQQKRGGEMSVQKQCLALKREQVEYVKHRFISNKDMLLVVKCITATKLVRTLCKNKRTGIRFTRKTTRETQWRQLLKNFPVEEATTRRLAWLPEHRSKTASNSKVTKPKSVPGKRPRLTSLLLAHF